MSRGNSMWCGGQIDAGFWYAAPANATAASASVAVSLMRVGFCIFAERKNHIADYLKRSFNDESDERIKGA